MTTGELMAYADVRISVLGLGPDGPLGTEHVVTYDDVGEGKLRISDGHSEDICETTQEVDQSLQDWVDWIDEDGSEDES